MLHHRKWDRQRALTPRLSCAAVCCGVLCVTWDGWLGVRVAVASMQYENDAVRESIDQMIIEVLLLCCCGRRLVLTECLPDGSHCTRCAPLARIYTHAHTPVYHQEMQRFKPRDYLASLPPPPPMTFGGNARLQAEYARVANKTALEAVDTSRCVLRATGCEREHGMGGGDMCCGWVGSCVRECGSRWFPVSLFVAGCFLTCGG